MARIGFCMILVILSLAGVSQKRKEKEASTYLEQPNRIEFDMEYNTSYQVISGEESGMMVVVETDDGTKEGYNWHFHLLDTLLNMQWTKIFPVPYDSYMLGYEYHGGKYYLLFNASRYHNEDLILLEIDSKTTEIIKMEISTVFPVQLSEFEVIGRNILLAGYTNYRPVLLQYNLDEKRPKVVPGFYDNHSDILDLIIDDDAGMFTVIQSERMHNRRYTIRAKTFTAEADLIQTNTISPGEKKNLIDGTSTQFYGGFQYMAGTYSKKASQYSRGLYLAKFVNGRQQVIRYHDYSDLSNFFGYMNVRRQERIRDRIERKRMKGKKANFSYRLLVHDIIQRGDEYMMIAEAYYPRYSNYNNVSGGYSGFTRFNPGFMGYNYTHAIVVAFDRNGNILWDNSFEINDVETYDLQEFVAVNTYEDKIVLMYLEENTIRSKVIKGDEILEGKTFSPVKLAYENDEVKNRNPEMEGLREWYDNTMYAYGEQRIRNENSTGGQLNRRIFYINKLQYQFEENPN